MADKRDDPTSDPKFQRVVRHFLKTPPKPRKPPKARSKRTKDKQAR